jgi:hypothetical protein
VTEARGPLSWTVEAPGGDVSAERPILLGVAAAASAAVVACAVGWFAHLRVGNRSLVLWSGVAVVYTAGLTVAWVSSAGWRRRRRNALIGVALFAAVIGFGTYLVLDLSRPTLVQLAHTIDGVDIPDDWRLLRRTESGNRGCDPTCPKIELVYRAPAGVEDPQRAYVRLLLDDGWGGADPRQPAETQSAAVRGLVIADVFQEFGSPEIRVVVQQRPAVTG